MPFAFDAVFVGIFVAYLPIDCRWAIQDIVFNSDRDISWYNKTNIDSSFDQHWKIMLLSCSMLSSDLKISCGSASAETINTFKNRLDKFWFDQEVLYNYRADLHGIGNRSIID